MADVGVTRIASRYTIPAMDFPITFPDTPTATPRILDVTMRVLDRDEDITEYDPRVPGA